MKNTHRIHESKESLIKEMTEHEPKLHKVPKTSLKSSKLKY